ncbi:unnamed protein product [Sympodiomycopsis kandeliae]
MAEGVGSITEFYKTSFLDLSFEDNTFGLVTSTPALHNPTSENDRHKALEELARVLKPGATLLVFDLCGYVRHFKNHMRERMKWQDVEMTWTGIGTTFGSWPTYLLRATKPL